MTGTIAGLGIAGGVILGLALLGYGVYKLVMHLRKKKKK